MEGLLSIHPCLIKAVNIFFFCFSLSILFRKVGKRDKNRCIEQPGVDICCKENLREVRAILYMVGVCVYGGGGFSEEFYM